MIKLKDLLTEGSKFDDVFKDYGFDVEKSMSEADGMSELVVKRAIDKAMQAAGIKVLKIDKMKSDKIKEPYGWFYKVKAGNKRVEDIMPFYVDERGKVNLGVASKDWIIGDVISGHSKMVKNLKSYKKTDLDEASLAKVKEVAMPLGSYLDHALADVEHLIDVVKSEHAEDAYRSPKKSGKLLAAAFKLLKKVK
jgi:hypothetical protein